MTKLSTKNADLSGGTTGDFIKPVLTPGNHKIKIHNVIFKLDPKFGDRIQLFVETEPVPTPFKGLPKDKTIPNGPAYSGQVGYINLDRWGYKDFSNDTVTILRNDEIFRAIGLLCRGVGLGLAEWWDNQDGKFDTVDELVNAFIKDRPFDGVWFFACVSGREYMNGTYLNYELYFPRESRTLGVAYSLNKDRVQTFFESTHIDRLKAKTETATASNNGIEVKAGEYTDKTVKDESSLPAKPQHVSQAELDFIKQGEIEREEKAKVAQSNAEFLADMNKDNPVEEQKDIVKSDDNEPLPWEV